MPILSIFLSNIPGEQNRSAAGANYETRDDEQLCNNFDGDMAQRVYPR